jgi:hypothetical protein
MNWKKLILAGIAGGIAFFVLELIIYKFFWVNFMTGFPHVEGVLRGKSSIAYLILANLSFGFLLSYIIGYRASISSLLIGLKAGLIAGFLLSIGFHFIVFGTTIIASITEMYVGVAIFTFITAVAGGIVGFILGKFKEG